MFDVPINRVLVKGLHVIKYNRNVVFSDGEHDLLVTGTNEFGNRLIASIIYDDDENAVLRYLHVLVTDSQFTTFFNRKISLRKILEEVESFFIVDVLYSGDETFHSIVGISDVPEEYLPMNDSFCPEVLMESSFEYSVSLKGRASDRHLATPDDLSSISSKFSSFLRSSTEIVSDLNLGKAVYIEALEQGSFKIKFKLDLLFEDQVNLFPVDQSKVKALVNDFFSYMFNDLPEEDDEVFLGEEIGSPRFKEIENSLREVYTEHGLKIPEAGLEQRVLDSINYSLNNFTELSFEGGFDRIEISNISSGGVERPMALINRNYLPSVGRKLSKLESEIKPDIITYDEFPQDYNVQVYSFNINTGNGGAWLMVSQNSIGKVSIHARGKIQYKNTLFTKSMDEGVIVEIKGRAKKVNNVVKEITIEF